MTSGGKTEKQGETDLGALERDLLEYRFSKDDDREVDGRSWDVIRRYGTQFIMKVGLNQPIMREVLEKIMNSMESDVLTESVTEDSTDDQQVTKKLPVGRARKGLKRLKGKTGSRAVNQTVVKSKASAVVASLTSAGRSGESGQGDGATLTGGEKERS